MRKLILFMLLFAAVAAGQTATIYTDRAVGTFPVGSGSAKITALVPVQFGQVRVCSIPLTQTQPCLPLATITDIFGNPISNSIGGSFGQVVTDVVGRFSFGCTAGANLQIQVAPTASNTPQLNYPVSCGIGISPTITGLNITEAGNANPLIITRTDSLGNLYPILAAGSNSAGVGWFMCPLIGGTQTCWFFADSQNNGNNLEFIPSTTPGGLVASGTSAFRVDPSGNGVFNGGLKVTTGLGVSGASTPANGISLTGVPITWNVDTGLSRLAAGIVVVGNGTQGDFSGDLRAGALRATPNSANGVEIHGPIVGINMGSANEVSWTSSTSSVAPDTGFSRCGVAIICVGNGTQNDFTGQLKAGAIIGTTTGAGPSGSFTTSNSSSTVIVTDTGGNGGNIELVGNGGTTPNKFLRSQSGSFSIVNSAYSSVILSLTDAGALNVTTGYQIAGAATNTHCLVGNGTNYVDGICGTGLVAPQVNTTAVTANAATTGNQTMQTVTFAAGTFNTIGKMFTVDAVGTMIGSTAGTQVIVGITVGGVIVQGSMVLTNITATNNWSLHLTCTTTAIGATGTVLCNGMDVVSLASSTTNGGGQAGLSSSATNSNLSAATAVTTVVTFSTSSASNSATSSMLTVVPNN